MPSQQVEIAEAIAGIKRALKREREGITVLSLPFLGSRINVLMVAPCIQLRPTSLSLPLRIEETSFNKVQNLFTKDL